MDLVELKQIERIKYEGQYLYLSSDKEQSTKQIEQRDQLSMQARRIPVFISEPMVIEILAEVICQSKRHLRADQLAGRFSADALFAQIPTVRFEPSDCHCVRCKKS